MRPGTGQDRPRGHRRARLEDAVPVTDPEIRVMAALTLIHLEAWMVEEVPRCTMRDLAATCKLSTSTVHRAIGNLAAEGLVRYAAGSAGVLAPVYGVACHHGRPVGSP